MARRDITFQEALNEAVRIGLAGPLLRRVKKFTQKTFRMGEVQEFRCDKALSVADAIEDQELGLKLTLNK
jgi:hypothetical protein